MKLNNLGYLIKEGIRGIFLHGFMSFAAVCITVACLLITGTFYSLTYNVSLMVEDLNKTNEILVYIDEELPYSEALSVGTDINLVDNVLKSTFKSREEALEDFIADHEGIVDQYTDYMQLTKNERENLMFLLSEEQLAFHNKSIGDELFC